MSQRQHEVTRTRQGMLAGMTPVLQPESYNFCTSTDEAIVQAAFAKCFAIIRETEGATLVLLEADALRLGFDTDLPMARIVLEVFSALDGVGLTAAGATALADHEISCNVVAAYHHDHVFVPRQRAEEAVRILKAVQERASSP